MELRGKDEDAPCIEFALLQLPDWEKLTWAKLLSMPTFKLFQVMPSVKTPSYAIQDHQANFAYFQECD